jgi:hypothetical protein
MQPSFSRGLLLASFLFLAAACASTSAQTSNKWRLEVSGGANADGTIVVQLLGVGAVIAEVPVQIPKGTGENEVARRISEELKLRLPADSYTAEIDDGEDVLIKKRGRVEDFEVRILSNSVQGTRVDVQRE